MPFSIWNYFDWMPLPGGLSNETISVSARNNTGVPQDVDFFSRVNPPGVVVQNSGLPTNPFITRIHASPLVIKSVKYFASGTGEREQRVMPITFVFQNAAGSRRSNSLTPEMFSTALQTSLYPIVMPFNFIIDSQTSVQTRVLPNTTVRIVFEREQPLDKSNILSSFRNFMATKWKWKKKNKNG